MRELLRGSLGKSLRALTPFDRLAAAWPVACGRSLADRSEILAYRDGTVTVQVRDGVWLKQMQSLRPQLLADLRRIASVELREIHFEVKDELAPGSSGRSTGRTTYRTRQGQTQDE